MRERDGLTQKNPVGSARRATRSGGVTAHAAYSAVRAGTPSGATLSTLQRTIGNRAVARLVADARERENPDQAGPHPVQRSAVHEVLRSPGQPLDEGTRVDMEARLGHESSDVRLHTGSAAQRSATEIGARAYTSGNHVVIGAGGSDAHTLAHELTHVIQQRQGAVDGTDHGDGLRISDPSDRFERAAETNATRALSGTVPSVRDPRPGTGGVAGLVAQRETADEGMPVQRVRRSRDEILDRLEGAVRQYDQSDGLKRASSRASRNLENKFPRNEDGSFQQFPDPSKHLPGADIARHLNRMDPKGPLANRYGSADWVAAINSQRDEPGTAFLRNCADASRAFVTSWYGRPTTAAGIHDPAPASEKDGADNTEDWLETPWRSTENNSHSMTWSAVEKRLLKAGHGSVAIVSFERQRGTVPQSINAIVGHAVNAVNYNGKIYWIDAQMGRIDKEPLYEATAFFMAIVLDSNFQPVDAPPPLPGQRLRGPKP